MRANCHGGKVSGASESLSLPLTVAFCLWILTAFGKFEFADMGCKGVCWGIKFLNSLFPPPNAYLLFNNNTKTSFVFSFLFFFFKDKNKPTIFPPISTNSIFQCLL